jgi:hypothetical protein
MSVARIFAFLEREGISLERDGADLIARPSSATTPEIVKLIRGHKAELLAELKRIETEGEVFEIWGRVREAKYANLDLEVEIVWEEDPSNFDYVRCYELQTSGRKRIAKWPMEGRRVGYAVLRPDAPHDPRLPGTFTRRVFFLKRHDRDSQPNGVYRTGAPAEAVDPWTVSPGVAAWLTPRAWGAPLGKSA